ncbi:Glycosyltransferase [Melia azedarach]|uniref:Glycosyltransferase n=1 Tax=Melia azedarach TaxID=155640 RepID=A0ACC1XFT3_MELAZ|nr:Glycosyltransferase [Melia azedarach]
MDTEPNQLLHFVLFPFMAQGHMIPMIDAARLLAQRSVVVTVFTTPKNAARFKSTLDRAIDSGLQIRLIQLQFPCVEAGLPDGCENFDMIPSPDLHENFYTAADMLQEPVEKLLGKLQPPPSCIISDPCLPYTSEIAVKFNIPRLVFHGGCCFCHACFRNVFGSNVLESVTSESEYFVVPNLPDRVEFTRSQVDFTALKYKEIAKKMFLASQATYGDIMNSFEEMEPAYYVEDLKKTKREKVWCIGPVSLSNKDNVDKAERGDKSSVDAHQCLKWLDSHNLGSVLFACLGSLCNLISSQLIQLGLGLEASNRPFVWVIRDGEASKELQKWVVEDGFEERIKGRGLVIWGWAPQVVILSHPAVGGFLTHCGWNSTLEGISAGVPLLTWPLFEDQFTNERLVQILRVGVRVGVERPMKWGEEQKIGVLVKREEVKNAVESLMDEGKEGEDRRERARELGKKAKAAVQEGGSSHLNITLLLEDIKQEVAGKDQSLPSWIKIQTS